MGLSKHGVGIEPLFRLDFWDCSRACAKGGGVIVPIFYLCSKVTVGLSLPDGSLFCLVWPDSRDTRCVGNKMR